ncbi:hypothetical protein AB1L88_03970 [Tautonia sp. JC769]|uniref:hypothetical protein n=1 Tax=Tautonia sp. JC769 TaxID=3232135 RepID=UPI0034583D75
MLSTTGNFALLGATALDPRTIEIRFHQDDLAEASPAEINLTVYRSADPGVDAGDRALVSTVLDVMPGRNQSARIVLSEPLGIVPEAPYVLVVAGGDADDADNVASFRKWTIGAVTHGFEPSGRMPSWVTSTAATLRQQGYDAVLPFDWARLSNLPRPGIPELVARRLAHQVAAMSHRLVAHGFQRQDVVDLHLIGHSRGGGVINLAAAALPNGRGPLAGGLVKLTMLDPHPARNASEVPLYSASAGPIGQLARLNFLAFQEAANDRPVVLAPGVDQLEVFHQAATVADPSPLVAGDERFVHSWGEVPVTIPAGSAVGDVAYYDLTPVVPSHTGITRFYQTVVAPTLGTGLPLDQLQPPLIASPSADPPQGGGFLPGTGFESELQVLAFAGFPVPVASSLLGEVQVLNTAIAEGNLPGARMQLRHLMRTTHVLEATQLPQGSLTAFRQLLGSTARLLHGI